MNALKTHEFLEAYPNDDREFFKELLEALETSSNLDKYHKQLRNSLTLLPYPTLQMMQHSSGKSQKWVDSTIEAALQQLLHDNSGDKLSSELVNFLANMPLRVLDASPSMKYDLINRLSIYTKNDQLYLALLCRQEEDLLDQLLDKLDEKEFRNFNCYPSKEFIAYTAIKQRQHFVPLASMHKNLNFIDVSDVAIRSNLLILKITNEFAQISRSIADISNISQWLKQFNVSSIPADLQEIHKFFYADFQRFHIILEFLKQFPATYLTITIETLLNANGVLRLLFDNDIDASYDETRRLIDSMHKWEIQMSTKSVRDQEMETLTYYFALSTVFDVILANSSLTTEQYFVSKMHKLNSMLRQMRNIDVLCSLIEDIFQLVFLRWENMRNTDSVPNNDRQAFNRSKSVKSYSANSSDDDGAETPALNGVSNLTAAHGVSAILRHGFICRGRALHCIFSFLKNFVTKKLHSEEYKNASERIQIRFQRIVEIIGEALWKYSVIEKIDDSIARGAGCNVQHDFILGTEELLQLVQMHVDTPPEKSSSDDESRDRCNYASLTRRKAAKKRRRATISGALVSQRQTNGGTLEQSRKRAQQLISSVMAAMPPNNSDPLIQFQANNIMTRVKNRSIIPRMLGSPENLAIMALAINNFNDVKYIIETFNLHNTELDRELNFVEHQQQVKQKLASIYANYQLEERKNTQQPGQPKATVEQIKHVVAKGFEASKIISVIDIFAQAQKIKQSDEMKTLLAKHCNNVQYARFLHQYEEANLNAVIITDLILNLPFNHETTTNILMVIKRQQQLGEVAAVALKKSDVPDPNFKVQLPQDIGCTHLLDNLCQCLRLLENTNLRDLLFDNYYSLKPRALALELERERAFAAVQQRSQAEFERVTDLRAQAKYFQNLQAKNNYYTRFVAYVGQLEKLLHLRDKNLELHSSELLKFDPCDIIGELLFEHNLTPLEIEANVAALNLNLVHVIALNICPEIAGRCGTTFKAAANSKLKQQTFYNYIWNHNKLLAYLLQSIDQSTDLSLENTMQPVYLQRLLKLPALEKLAQLYGCNKFIAAMHADRIDVKLIDGMSTKLSKLEILLLKFGNQAPNQLQHKLIDDIIKDLIQEDAKNIHLAVHIHDIALKASLIQANFTKIATTRLAKELIDSTLQHKDVTTRVPHHLRLQLEDTLADITVYAKVSEVLQFESWPQAYDFGLKTPFTIFEKLLKMQHYKLCYHWCKVVKLSQTATFEQHKHAFFAAILKALLDYNESNVMANSYLLQIMASFPVQDCCKFLQANKDSFRSVELLRYILKYLTEHCAQTSVDNNLKNYKISLVIFEQLNQSVREQVWKLLKCPLLIIEQLIMNAKFEVLAKVLKAVRSSLSALNESLTGANVHICEFCFDKRGNFDSQTRSIARNSDPNSTFILLNFNLYQKDHVITNECIDLLLRIYATKALDYQMSDTCTGTERNSHSSADMQQSLDSLCDEFRMPKVAPTRDEWVRDDEAAHCMCCRRAVFTMLMRRHHCRRCGRVVCFACSTHRLHIPELYADVEVRICNDCHNFLQEPNEGNAAHNSISQDPVPHSAALSSEKHSYRWRLSGNITHDKLLREEFCYEHAPSVALCLSILTYHLDQKKCIDLLLYQCRKMEKFIVPNPEVDYELISKMMNCLALAAKVRGGRAETETICDHSEIIMSLVQNGCESLIPVGPLKNHSIRKLADSLVQAEKWELALEVHLKYGFPTAGVMAAHGLSCLRAGCFDTAREKLSHCMPKLSNELANSKICNFILSTTTDFSEAARNQTLDFSKDPHDILYIKRPHRGPALLLDILQIIESIACTKPQPETLLRASIIRNSNTSLSSLLSRRKDTPYPVIPMHEPALNILTTLANLKRLSKGHYNEGNDAISSAKLDNRKHLRRQTRVFEEATHYVLMYGSHTDILQFLMRQQELSAALKYCVVQNLNADFLIHNIFLVALRCGEVPALIEQMLALDAQLYVWRDVLKQICRYLESKNLLNSLYQLQLLLKDPIRASMTCVKFYSMGCENFQQLHMQAQHLNNAHKHLLSELELSQWENINLEKVAKRKDSLQLRRSSSVSVTSTLGAASFAMQMDPRSLNSHINTILKQLDVAKFLANCERERGTDKNNILITEKILKQIRIEPGKNSLPTLFDSATDKIQICILILLSGINIEEGFGLAYRIIHDYKIPAMKVFGATAKYLARNQRLNEVEKLIDCITGTNKRDIDEIISIAIHSAAESHKLEVKTALDNLARKISSIELLISIHIFLGQLKSAYLLANKYERLGDIRKILRQAETSNQIHIKKLCEKKLNINHSQI